jgi:hypothetical protein
MFCEINLSRRWLMAGAVALTLSVPAAAQIRVLNPFGGPQTLNPFGSRQGSVSALSTSTSTGYSATPKLSNGLAPKYLNWNGHDWSNDSGQTWNTNASYAVQIAPTKVRYEVHDTPNDRGQNDPSTKRRSELSSTKDKFHNHTDYWMAFSFKVHWSCQSCQLKLKQGGEIMQVHWPSGASPPLAFRAIPTSTGAAFTVTTRGANTGNITRAKVPLTLDAVHDVVFHFKLGAVGYEQVWLDGKQISNVSGIPVGTDLEDGYSMRLGPYYGGGLAGNVVVQEYGNVAAFPSTAILSSRVLNPPAW